MLPGCLLAGIGLGLTNTPVTNTTTGAVPPERAGMASSIDISARMISLSINIALMGFILLQGILSSLREQYPALADGAHLRHLALALTAGQASAALGVSTEMASTALAHGFGWVMLYGGLSAWGMALASWLVFGANRAAPEPALPV